jgi:tetratricopeptide (TPR) repeat protein
MPYRTRDTQAQPPAPSRVDFDALWEKALRPAIEGLGYRPVRADQDLGPLIIKEMLERLYFSDLVVADLSIPNGNVYYEVGIRHAAKDGGCVLVSADWAKPLFDMDQMRQIRYPLPEGEISDGTAAAIRESLTTSIPALATSGSPMYETLEGYPANVRADRARTIADFLDELAAFQEATRRVPFLTRLQQADAARAVRDQHGTKRPIVAAVAVELVYLLRDFAGFDEALAFLDSLPVQLQKLPAMREQRCLAQSKSGDHQTAIAALEELIATVGPSAERYGLLGGRYKKLADSGTAQERARFLGLAIDAYERGMQTDLNDYYPSSNLPRLYRRRGRTGDDERARRAAAVALAACERAKRLFPNDEWIRPTLLGLAFDAGDAAKAEELADEVAMDGAARWKLDTTLEDLRRSVELTTQADSRARLSDVVARLELLSS